MTTQDTIRRALRLMLVLSVLTVGGAFFHEHGFTDNAIETTGKIISFKKKKYSSAQEDSIEMEIRFSVKGQQKTFYASRNFVEVAMGTYKPGDLIPVVYNAGKYPYQKIGRPQHLYRLTLTFVVLWMLFFTGLACAWYKNARNKTHQMPSKKDVPDD